MSDEADRASALADAFATLTDETRVSILEALAAQQREGEEPFVGFSDLRRRVGVRDSGNFNYHLQQLRGTFVRKTERGYRLTNTGLEVVTAVLAGSYQDYEEGPVEDVTDCFACGEPMRAEYAAGSLTLTCPAGHGFENALPPSAVRDRDLESAVRLLTIKAETDIELAVSGLCPLCYGEISWGVSEMEDEHVALQFDGRCTECGAVIHGTAGTVVVRHPAVVSFLYDHGIDVRDTPFWTLDLPNDEETYVESRDPLRVRVDLTLDDERLSVWVDGDAAVSNVERAPTES